MLGDKREKGGWGARYHLSFPQLVGTDSWAPNVLSSFGLHGFVNLRPNLALTMDLLGGAKIPKPQQELQSQIFNQIDISAIFNGAAEEQEINIQGEFEGFVNLQAQFGLRQRFRLGKLFQPYAELGLQLSIFQSFLVEIDTTILFDPGDLLSGGSQGNPLGFDPSESGVLGDGGRVGTVDPGPYVGLGCLINIGDKAAWDISARYQSSFAAFRQGGEYTNFLSFQTGLVFRINQKRLRYYEYIR